ncbi:NADH:flavin oxidoreductase [Arcobacter sp. CECT 8989]|uniref:NADH:flavin oxidoreductase/NADH oxidase n=1 Tax=Arcobacter sp. CECT 8989 TaxID=2044509 RepID=UPI00100BCD34|nr:NADH:flavin oxidoreductase/NADH oxidase [Arcobacter sp. CECT 8989]RXK01469.1 NADH:flavin oxidoreductase [Arcobacter sp. CECT 8989]
MSLLLSPSSIGNCQLKNKVVMPPMCMYKSDNSAKVTAFHSFHYTSRAIGNVGLIIVEATAVEPRGRISNNDLGLWEDSQIAGHKLLVDQAHEFGSKIAIQLAHAGRKSLVKETTPIAPSSIAFDTSGGFKTPQSLDLEQIALVKQLFLDSAKRAKEAGYDILELHAAHGYLLCEFLSPLTNKREDIYGGSLENRCRLTLEIAKLLKEQIDLPLIVRISASEWKTNGWDIEDSIYLSKELEKLGVDSIHVSAGGNQKEPDLMPELSPLYQCDYAKKIKESVSIPVIAVGLITTAKQGETLLEDKVCDFVAYGRELLRDANLVFKLAKEFNQKELIDSSYLRAYL